MPPAILLTDNSGRYKPTAKTSQDFPVHIITAGQHLFNELPIMVWPVEAVSMVLVALGLV